MSIHDLWLHDPDEYQARCICGKLYDGVNCSECWYFNEAWILPENYLEWKHFESQRQEVALIIEWIVDAKWKKEGTLKINISDPWTPQIVYIDYTLETSNNMRQLSDEDEVITAIDFDYRQWTSSYSKAVITESNVNIESEIRKVFYWT